jgi:hypothetical protein
MNEKLSLKEQKILWAVLNQAQHIGLRDTAALVNTATEVLGEQVVDWVKQTAEEYDIINTLKVKLCGDLE